jgi:hypothetical protein
MAFGMFWLYEALVDSSYLEDMEYFDLRRVGNRLERAAPSLLTTTILLSFGKQASFLTTPAVLVHCSYAHFSIIHIC